MERKLSKEGQEKNRKEVVKNIVKGGNQRVKENRVEPFSAKDNLKHRIEYIKRKEWGL